MAMYFQPAAVISSDKDTQFTLGLALNAAEDENLVGLPDSEGVIASLAILSDQQLAWEIQFYLSDTFSNADLDLDTYLGSYRFAEGDGRQVAGAGAFYYDASHLDLPYRDVDGTRELHVRLVNRSIIAKNAGVGGEIVIRATFEPFRNIQA
jgi:hypothetical protein